MSTVDEIEAAIDGLPEDSRWKLAQRLNARLWDAWDEETESDAWSRWSPRDREPSYRTSSRSSDDMHPALS